jgi:hypothetical protein
MAIQREENPQRPRKPKTAKAKSHDATMTGRENITKFSESEQRIEVTNRERAKAQAES